MEENANINNQDNVLPVQEPVENKSAMGLLAGIIASPVEAFKSFNQHATTGKVIIALVIISVIAAAFSGVSGMAKCGKSAERKGFALLNWHTASSKKPPPNPAGSFYFIILMKVSRGGVSLSSIPFIIANRGQSSSFIPASCKIL